MDRMGGFLGMRLYVVWMGVHVCIHILLSVYVKNIPDNVSN